MILKSTETASIAALVAWAMLVASSVVAVMSTFTPIVPTTEGSAVVPVLSYQILYIYIKKYAIAKHLKITRYQNLVINLKKYQFSE